MYHSIVLRQHRGDTSCWCLLKDFFRRDAEAQCCLLLQTMFACVCLLVCCGGSGRA